MNDVNGRRQTTTVGLVAAGGGAGRTSAATNLAWIIASADNRVLVVDWGSERPSVHDYLRPFLVADSSAGPVTGNPLAQPPGVLREYAVPEGSRRVHVLAVAAGASPDVVAAEWERWVRAEDYDYVLVDGPTDISPAGLSRVAGFCDTVLLFFLPRITAIEQAGDIARGLAGHVGPGPRIIPVLSQFDDRNPVRAKQSRENVRSVFAETGPAGRPPHETIELPYQAYDEYDEALAVLIDEPGEDGTPLAAYTRLAVALTDGRVTALTPAPPATRARYRHRLGLPAAPFSWRMAVAYDPVDRPWADWVRQRLERADVTVFLVPPGRELPADANVSSLVVVTSDRAGREETDRVALLAERLSGPDGLEVVELVVPDHPDHGEPDVARDRADGRTGGLATERIVVGNRRELDVGGHLLARFGLFDSPGEGGRAAIRFPGDTETPVLHNLPPRRPDFVGREDVLGALRDWTTEPGTERRWACTGPGGAGKSELVREFAHRFGFHYDLIWWIPAHDLVAVRAALLRLAAVKSVTDTGDGVRAVLDAVSSGEWYERSLLVYDNADLAKLAASGLLPSGAAVDVVVTARAPADDWRHLEVGAFTDAECVSLVRTHVPELAPSAALRVGNAVLRQPLATRLAAGLLAGEVAWLRAEGLDSAGAGQRAVTELTGALAGIEHEDEVLPGVLTALRHAMRRTQKGQLALGIAEMCAFLSPEGVSLRMLRADAFVRTIALAGGHPADELLFDAGLLDQVLWTGTAYGLYEASWGQAAALLTLPALQDALRKGPGAAAARTATLAALAAYAPSETALPTAGTRAKFEELQRHIFASGALSSDDPVVRRWLVNHLRFLFLNPDGATWRFTLDTAAEVIERWRSAVGDDDALLLRMRGQLANLHRAIGEFDEAAAVDAEVLDTQRHVLGSGHLQTLISTRARAADLRSIGSYGEAYAEDHEARDGFRNTLGDDHPHTRMASHNLAISAYLVGDVATALDIQRDHHARQRRLLGRQAVDTWKSAASAGVYLRELGRLQEADEILSDALHHVTRAGAGARRPDLLWIEWQLATVRRRLGNRLWAKESNTRTVASFRDLLGAHNPNTRGCLLSLAADHHACGAAERAVAIATDCLAGYEQVAADHPVTAVCRMNLALYLRAGGLVPAALSHGEAAAAMLDDWLGATHPWTILARANHAATLAISGDMAAALAVAADNDRLATDLLAADHPYRRVSAGNLARMGEGTTLGRWHELDIDVLPN